MNEIPPSPLNDGNTFWLSDEPHVAVSPHRPEDAAGLAEFATASAETRNLLYFQTSGSEGIPKWVGLSRVAFLSSARAVNAHLEASSKDRWLIALPLHHVGGFAILGRCHAAGSSFFHMEEKWNAGRFVELCSQEGITLASLVPAQVYDLVQGRHEAPVSLRAVVVGGGALAKNIGLRAVSLGWRVLQSYGMTEACSQIATEPLDHLYAGFDPDSLEVLPGWDLQASEAGTLTVRGPALASGYAMKRDGLWSWEPIDAVGGLVTRDHVQLWRHGTRRFLRFLGRDSSFVKVLGELVNLTSLQARLDGLAVQAGLPPGTAVILPMDDPRKDTRLVLVGEPPAERLDALLHQLNVTSAGYERLQESRVVTALPRTSLGKLDAAALRTQLASTG